MALSITQDVFKSLATAMGRDSCGQVDLPKALPLITQFLQGVKPSDFDSPKWNWHRLTAWVERPQAQAAMTPGEERMPDVAVVAVDINCDAGLFVFNVETQAEGIWADHVRQNVVVAKTDSVWDGFKRFIGYEDDVKTNNFGMMYLPNGYPVDKVTALSTLPAAQALFTRICE